MTLFTVVAAESIVIVVKEVIIRHTVFNGRTQRRDSLKWYEEVGKQVNEHVIAYRIAKSELQFDILIKIVI